MVCAIIVPWDCLLRNFSIYTFQLDALTQAFCYRLREAVVIGGLLQCLLSGLHRFVHWEQVKRQERAITWRQRATYCVGTLSYGLHVIAGVGAPCWFGPNEAVFCIYIYNALQHFNIIYKTKGNRRINRLRQSMHFFHMNIRNPLRPFSNGHILECLLCIGTVPRPVVTFLVTSLSICVCLHATTILTLWTT